MGFSCINLYKRGFVLDKVIPCQTAQIIVKQFRDHFRFWSNFTIENIVLKRCYKPIEGTVGFAKKFALNNLSWNLIDIMTENKLIPENFVVVHRAVTSAATFLVAPGLMSLLFKMYSAASMLTTFKRCTNRWFYFLTKQFF